MAFSSKQAFAVAERTLSGSITPAQLGRGFFDEVANDGLKMEIGYRMFSYTKKKNVNKYENWETLPI